MVVADARDSRVSSAEHDPGHAQRVLGGLQPQIDHLAGARPGALPYPADRKTTLRGHVQRVHQGERAIDDVAQQTLCRGRGERA